MGDNTSDIISKCFLRELYPFPFVYRNQDRNTLGIFAKEFSEGIESVKDTFPYATQLYESVLECIRYDSTLDIHPLQLAAGVLFEDGFIDVAWQLKGLEYGCTLDCTSQLLHTIEQRRVKHEKFINTRNSSEEPIITDSVTLAKPLCVLVCDQFGVCHAPFAQARAIYTEFGYGYVSLITHNSEGKCVSTRFDDLLPQLVALMSNTDFPTVTSSH
jgi:hypothetical protein